MTAVLSWAAQHTGPWFGLCLAGASLVTIGVILMGVAIGSLLRGRR